MIPPRRVLRRPLAATIALWLIVIAFFGLLGTLVGVAFAAVGVGALIGLLIGTGIVLLAQFG